MTSFRAGVVGLGGIYPMHVRSLDAIGVPVVAVCDKDGERARDVGALLGARVFVDYGEMLDAGGFEVLHVCLPHFLHAPVAIAALEAGMHVLCEKPLATTFEDAEKMAAAADKSGKVLQVVFQNRFNPGTWLIKGALQTGKLGALLGGYLRVTWHRGVAYYAGSDWRGRWATEGGGALINQAIHIFDLMNYFLGAPQRVVASTANRAHPDIEVEDVAEGVIFYGENGDVPISFFVNTLHPYDAPVTLEIIGENGTATLIGEDAQVRLKDGTNYALGPDLEAQRKYEMKSYWGVSHIKQITAFYEALQNDEIKGFNDPTALATQKLIGDIYTAAKAIKKPRKKRVAKEV